MAVRKGSGLPVSCADKVTKNERRQNAAATTREGFIFHLQGKMDGKTNFIGKRAPAHPGRDGTARPEPETRGIRPPPCGGFPVSPAAVPGGSGPEMRGRPPTNCRPP